MGVSGLTAAGATTRPCLAGTEELGVVAGVLAVVKYAEVVDEQEEDVDGVDGGGVPSSMIWAIVELGGREESVMRTSVVVRTCDVGV